MSGGGELPFSAISLLADKRWLEGAGLHPRAVSHILSTQSGCSSPANSCASARKEGGQVWQAFWQIQPVPHVEASET